MIHKISDSITCEQCSKLAFATINDRNLCSSCLFAEILSMLEQPKQDKLTSVIPLQMKDELLRQNSDNQTIES